MDSAPRVWLLGPVAVSGADGPIELTGAKQAGVLAVLALSVGRAVRSEDVVEAVWGEDPPRAVHNSVQVHVHALRKALARAGAADPHRMLGHGTWGYRLHATTDVEQFEELVAGAAVLLAHGDHLASLKDYDRALALVRGSPLGGTPDTPVFDAARVRLASARAVAESGRLESLLGLGRHAEAVTAARSLIERDPYRESAWVAMLVALYRAGRATEALAGYAQVRSVLRDDLGLDPGPELTALHTAILRQDPLLLGRATAPAATVPDRAASLTGLPWYPDPLVGRSSELVALIALLTDSGSRMVTVVGPGGAGKTRVAVEVAQRVCGLGFERVAFIDLTGVAETDELANVVHQALLVDQEDTAELDRTPTLVILDNAEHLAGPVAAATPALLGAMPTLRLLLTSRVALGVRGEHRFALRPLPPQDAVSLFADRARACVPDFRLDPATASQALRLCARLDHLPLAIELVSARLTLFTMSDLEERLDVDVLTIHGSLDLPARQSTLGETVRSSVALLSGPAARLLEHLSVFRGGFTLASASAVSRTDERATLAGLEELVNISMVMRTASTSLAAPGVPTRFALLETIRLYSADLLAKNPDALATREAHARYVELLFSTPARPEPDRPAALMLAEQANFGAALDFLLARDPERAANLLIQSARTLFLTINHPTIDDWCSRVLSALGSPSPAEVSLVAMRGVLAYQMGADDRAVDLLDGTAARLRALDRPGYVAVTALLYRAALLVDSKDPMARQASEDTVAAVQRSADPQLVGHAHNATMYATLHLDDPTEAIAVIRRCVTAARELNNLNLLSHALRQLSQALLDGGQAEAALRAAREAVAISEQAPDNTNLSSAHTALGRCLVRTGRSDQAVPHLAAAVLGGLEAGRAVDAMAWLALALISEDQISAARVLGAAQAEHERFADTGPMISTSTDAELRTRLDHLEQEIFIGRAAKAAEVTEWVRPLCSPTPDRAAN